MAGRQAFEHSLVHDFSGIAADGIVGAELGVEGAADLIQVKGLTEHRQFGRLMRMPLVPVA